MRPKAYLIPVGHYDKTTFKDWPTWVTDYYDVRVYLEQKVVRSEHFDPDSFKAAERFCQWLENGLTSFLGPVTY